MSLLRIRASLADAPVHCQWALVNDGRPVLAGEGTLAELPRRAERIQLVLPAAQVLITRARVPRAARRRAGSVLAFAVEEKTAGEPDGNQASWLGAAGDDDVLAVTDKAALTRWREALAGAGLRGCEVHCETLLLPRAAGEWSIAWNGREGYVRTGELEGGATDCGDAQAPPLSLRLMLEEAKSGGTGPASLALYTTAPDTAPDIEAWTRELGVAVRLAGSSDWRSAPSSAGVSLSQERQRWGAFAGSAARLKPAAWIVGAALALQAVALVVDWTSLANEQRALRAQMDSRFRATFPDAVAVVDPTLQMRRKLAQARHAAGQSDRSDFLPMIEQVAGATKELPAGAVRAVSYEGGRLTIELSAADQASVRRIVARLNQSGLSVETAAGAAGAPIVLTVRAS
jgi:general secretion pathway protein L